MAATRFHLSYRSDHVLEADGGRWEIDANWNLSGKMPAPKVERRVRFQLDLSSLDADWQAAIARGTCPSGSDDRWIARAPRGPRDRPAVLVRRR